MLLKEVCVVDVACCGRDTRIGDAARLMRQFHTGDLVVVDDPQGDRTPVGILTDRDIVIDVLGQGIDPAQTTVAQVMNHALVIAQDTEDSSLAIERMHAHGVRRVPVVNRAGSLVGVFTLDDAWKLHAARAAELVETVAKGIDRERRTRR